MIVKQNRVCQEFFLCSKNDVVKCSAAQQIIHNSGRSVTVESRNTELFFYGFPVSLFRDPLSKIHHTFVMYVVGA